MKNVLNKNLLINRFMDIIYDSELKYWRYKSDFNIIYKSDSEKDTIPYQLDYNYLMMVIDKIETLTVKMVTIGVEITQYGCKIKDGAWHNSNITKCSVDKTTTKKDATYNCIVDFCEWYFSEGMKAIECKMLKEENQKEWFDYQLKTALNG